MSQTLQVVLYRRDLRVDDHEPLALAAKRGPVLPLYVAEPALIAAPTFDPRHWTFIRGGLIELRRRLFAIGQPLVVRAGALDDVLEGLRNDARFTRIWLSDEVGSAREADSLDSLRAWAKSCRVTVTTVPMSGIEREPNARRDLTAIWEDAVRTPIAAPPARLKPATGVQPGPIPDHADLGLDPDLCSDALRGGESVARHALTSFLSRRAEQYDADAVDPAGDESSTMSAYLTWGNLSLRQVAHAVRARETELRAMPPARRAEWEAALGLFERRLLRRSELLQAFVDGPAVESTELDRATAGLRPLTPDRVRFDAWSAGLTGYPMVDAAMRCLRETGRLSYRMRAMLVSFAAYDLWLDWREAGNLLARRSLDYEPAIHWRLMQAHAGTAGESAKQVYNPTKQGLEHDPAGEFVRRWVPELERVPASFIHTPWLLPEGMQESLGCVIGRHYPAPIVDHALAVRDAQRRIAEAREHAPSPAESPAPQPEKPPRRTARPASKAKRAQRERPTQLSLPLD